MKNVVFSIAYYCDFHCRIQVRRTDKINLEAAFHGVEEYMYWVNRYYEKLKLTQTVDKKRVFIATDDSSVLDDAKKK